MGKIQTNQLFSQSVSHRVNFPGGGGGVYTMYVRSDLFYSISDLKLIWAISVVLNILLSFCQVHKNFEESVVVIVIFVNFITFSSHVV